MQNGKSNGGVLSPKRRITSAKVETKKKQADRIGKQKSSEFELKGTNDLQVENEHLRTVIERMQLEKDVAASRLQDVELL